MRKLASVQLVEEIRPIEGADRIEHIRIAGWWVIQAKGLKVGEKVVYIEIDSKVPETDAFEFLRKNKFRVKTMKMRGVLSQGLVMTMPSLGMNPDKYNVDSDVTKELGIVKYDIDDDDVSKEVKMSAIEAKHKRFINSWIGKLLFKSKRIKKWFYKRWTKKAKGAAGEKWPTHIISKSDETRIENLPMYWGAEDLVETEKLEGTSATYTLEKKKFLVCSRNQVLPKGTSGAYWTIAEKCEIEPKLTELSLMFGSDKVGIQGEIIGPGIQGNYYGLDEIDFYVYAIFINSYEAKVSEVERLSRVLGLKFVPKLSENVSLPKDISEIKLMASGKSVINNKVDREGVVYRFKQGDISFKNVSNEYLLKKKG